MTVDVELDLRAATDVGRSAAEVARLWTERIEPAITGRALQANKPIEILSKSMGTLILTPVFVPPGIHTLAAETPIAVRALLQKNEVVYPCGACQREGKREHGPFVCCRCEPRRAARVCEQHVTILDGSLRAFCTEHVPRASDGSPMTFWCAGPFCRDENVWPESQRMRHPSAPQVWFCRKCYDELYPPCEVASCKFTGSVRCEFVDALTGNACRVPMCSRHARRWQIFGGEKVGMALCHRHRREYVGLPPAPLLLQVAAVTVRRQASPDRRAPDERYFLPSLSKTHDIFIRTGKGHVEVNDLLKWWEDVASSIQAHPVIREPVLRLIQSKMPLWKQEHKQIEDTQAAGRALVRQLKALLVEDGFPQIAAAVEFSYYTPRSRILFVKLEDSMRGLMIGRGGARIRALSERLGAVVKFEGD